MVWVDRASWLTSIVAACAAIATGCVADESSCLPGECAVSPQTPGFDATLVVSDRAADAVLLFDTAGRAVRRVVPDERGDGGPIDRPSSVRFDALGHMYLANFGHGEILEYVEPAGRFDRVFYADSWWLQEPVNLIFHGTELFVLGNDTQNVVVLDRSGALVREFGREEVRRPHGFVFGSEGELFIATSWDGNAPGMIQVWDPEQGTLIGRFGDAADLDDATGLAIGPDRMLYVVDYYRARILRYDPLDRVLVNVFFDQPGVLDGPVALTFGPGGDLYVAAANGIHRIHADGSYGGLFVAPGTGGLSGPRGLLWRYGEAATRLR